MERRYSTRAVRGGRKRSLRGGKLTWGSIKDFFVNKVNPFLKKTKLASTVLNALGTAGLPYASTGANLVGKLGYGRKRRIRRVGGMTTSRKRRVGGMTTSRKRRVGRPRAIGRPRRAGGSLRSLYNRVQPAVKQHRLISRAMSHASTLLPPRYSTAASLLKHGSRAAHDMGYGALSLPGAALYLPGGRLLRTKKKTRF